MWTKLRHKWSFFEGQKLSQFWLGDFFKKYESLVTLLFVLFFYLDASLESVFIQTVYYFVFSPLALYYFFIKIIVWFQMLYDFNTLLLVIPNATMQQKLITYAYGTVKMVGYWKKPLMALTTVVGSACIAIECITDVNPIKSIAFAYVGRTSLMDFRYDFLRLHYCYRNISVRNFVAGPDEFLKYQYPWKVIANPYIPSYNIPSVPLEEQPRVLAPWSPEDDYIPEEFK